LAGEYRLSPGEYEALKRLAKAGFREGTLEEAARIAGIDKSALASLVHLLAEKGILDVEAREEEYYVLTEKGREALEEGLPEEKLVILLAEAGGSLPVAAIREKLGPLAGIAIGQARRKGFIEIAGGTARLVVPAEKALEESRQTRRILEEVAEGAAARVPEELRRRGLVATEKRKETILRARVDLQEVLEKSSVEIAKLTHEMLASGEWRRMKLRPYDVRAEPPIVYPARKHFLSEFIEMLRDMMKELGFVEVSGPLVEIELFNFDLLFQAQDHPAREIHDTLWIKEPRRASLEEYSELVERVARIHEEGWGYKWNPSIAARYLLRSQTTSVSARTLASRPEPPIRFFTLGRVYRSDVVDATHLPEFHQLDGIMGWPGYTFRDLIGLLQEVANRLGLRLKLKPAYFPFTEPSVEGYVRLPNGKWLELFGAGMFRPEVLEAAGVDYPVGAWGFGVERLAAAFYGIQDIRNLYTREVDRIRSFPLKSI